MALDPKLLIMIATLAIQAINVAWYVKGVYRGQTRPHMFTWFLWVLVSLIAGFGQLQAGAGFGAYITLFGAFTCFLRGVAGITHGVKDFSRGDWTSLGLCLVAIALWVILKHPVYALLTVTFARVIAFYPTLRKSWIAPYSEPAVNMLVMTLIHAATLLALESYNLATIILSASVVTTDMLCLAVILLRRRVVPNSVSG